MSLYPKAPLTPSLELMDANEVAKRIIEGMETGKITFPFTTSKYGNSYKLPGLTKGDFTGPCLRLADDPDDVKNPGRGSDDIATYNRVWDEIHAEKSALAGVSVIEYSSKPAYIAALALESTHLDPLKWADGTIAANEVASFTALKTKLTVSEEL